MIPLRNIFYMLLYVLDIQEKSDKTEYGAEHIKDALELLTEFFILGLRSLIRRGLDRDYVTTKSITRTPKGKILITHSCQVNQHIAKLVTCEETNHSVDTYNNRIIKSLLLRLLPNAPAKQHTKLRQLLRYFSLVSETSLERVNWALCFATRNTKYQTVMRICQFIVQELIPVTGLSGVRMNRFFSEKKQWSIYETFLRNYFKRHHSHLTPDSPRLNWALESNYEIPDMLPAMRTDLVLHHNNKELIIDAKYYTKNISLWKNKETFRSHNLYQLYTYIDSHKRNTPSKVTGGMLLYAKTEEDSLPDQMIPTQIGPIYIRTIDLSADFAKIKDSLNQIAYDLTNCSNFIY